MKVSILSCGYCVHPEFVAKKDGTFRSVSFPSTVVLLNHPTHGIVLFDTGYTNAFFEETRRFPERLYALLAPVRIDQVDTAVEQLRAVGINASDVSHIILSHFHADHIAGLRDFPRATIHFASAAYEALAGLPRWRRLKHGFLPGLLPADFDARSRPIRPEDLQAHPTGEPIFRRGFDIFADGSVFVIPLPGHVTGHIGIIIRSASCLHFFIGDAAWSEDNFLHARAPKRWAVDFLGDYRAYLGTLERIASFAQLQPHASIVPCHCSKATAAFRARTDAHAEPL